MFFFLLSSSLNICSDAIHFYQMRYIDFFYKRVENRDKGILEGLSDKNVKDLSEQFPNFYEGQVRGALKWLPWLITVIWGVYIVVILFS